MKSEHARAAAEIKAKLTRKGYKVMAKSQSYSMGNSIRVVVLTPDLPPETRKEIESFCNEYQYGHFDGMTDMYEYSNTNKSLPQSKFVFCSFTQSDECKQAVRDYLNNFTNMDDFERQQLEYQVWTGAFGDFWDTRKTAIPEAVAMTGSYSIGQHTHTKKGFDFFIVILADRVDRDQFDSLRDSCKSAGGWYSRQWGTTPGGFAFKEQEQAESWAAFTLGSTPPDKPIHKAPTNSSLPGKLRTMADKLTPQIKAKHADRQTNTPKRQLQAASARIEGDRLERTQQALNALASLHEAGAVPPELSGVTTKSAVFDLVATKTDHPNYYSLIDTGEPRSDTPTAKALWQIIEGKSDEQKAADELADRIRSLQFARIPGYFPTPPTLVAQMIDKADIQPESTVLEPSAGSGAILDALPACIPGAYETNHTLRDILKAKGWPLLGDNFMEADPAVKWDRVLMNPPFENMQDVDHIRHAYSLLNPDGKLVAIMSPSAFYRETKKAQEFREWFLSVNGECEDIESGAFKESGTMVASKMIVITRC